jgi:hypothetical protein
MDVSKSVGAVFALAAAATALCAALIDGAPATGAVLHALIALLVCYAIGSVAGAVLGRVVRDVNDKYERDNPVPEAIRPGAAEARAPATIANTNSS